MTPITDNAPIHWESRIEFLEHKLNTYPYKFTYRFNLGDDTFWLWSRRIGRKFRLLLAQPEGSKYIYQPFLEADYHLVQRHSPRLIEFYSRFMEYCDSIPQHLW